MRNFKQITNNSRHEKTIKKIKINKALYGKQLKELAELLLKAMNEIQITRTIPKTREETYLTLIHKEGNNQKKFQ